MKTRDTHAKPTWDVICGASSMSDPIVFFIFIFISNIPNINNYSLTFQDYSKQNNMCCPCPEVLLGSEHTRTHARHHNMC